MSFILMLSCRPAGQRTILDAELRNVGMGHLTKQLDHEVQVTRAQGGKVCQVTPVADAYAREAMRRLKGRLLMIVCEQTLF